MESIGSSSRRDFLLAAGLGGAGVAAAVAGVASKVKKVAVDAPHVAQGDSYRASPHVMKYYKTTEV